MEQGGGVRVWLVSDAQKPAGKIKTTSSQACIVQRLSQVQEGSCNREHGESIKQGWPELELDPSSTGEARWKANTWLC